MRKTWIRLISFVFVGILFLSCGDVEAKKTQKSFAEPIAERKYTGIEIARVDQYFGIYLFQIKDELYCSLHEIAFHLNKGTDPFNIVWNSSKKRTEIHLHQKYTKEFPRWDFTKHKMAINWASADLWIGEKSEKFTGFVHDNQFFVSLKQLANYVGFSYKMIEPISGHNQNIVLSTRLPEGVIFEDAKAIFPNTSKVNFINRWAERKESFLYQENGQYLFLYSFEKNNHKYIMKNIYDKDWKKMESKELAFFGKEFGGFLAGKNYNYFVFGQDNPAQDDNLDVFTVIKTDKNFKEIGRVGIKNCYTVYPFHSGTVSLAEYENTLVLHTSRKRYVTSDGLNHQSQFSVAIDIPTMRILTHDLENFQPNYVSHSFHQFALFDEGGNVFLIDHGDALPRSVQVIKMDKSLNHVYGSGKLFRIPGTSGANQTGISLGDVLQTKQNLIIGVNQIDYSKATFFDSFEIQGKEDVYLRDVYLYFVNKNSMQVKSKKLTDYTKGKERYNFSVPYLLKVGDNKMLALWMKAVVGDKDWHWHRISEILQYQLFDFDGNALSPIMEKPWFYLSNMYPYYENGTVFWIFDQDYDEDTTRKKRYIRYELDISDLLNKEKNSKKNSK